MAGPRGRESGSRTPDQQRGRVTGRARGMGAGGAAPRGDADAVSVHAQRVAVDAVGGRPRAGLAMGACPASRAGEPPSELAAATVWQRELAAPSSGARYAWAKHAARVTATDQRAVFTAAS